MVLAGDTGGALAQSVAARGPSVAAEELTRALVDLGARYRAAAGSERFALGAELRRSTSRILPPYMRRSPKVTGLVPVRNTSAASSLVAG
jgi:hypothetical protein